MKQANREVAIIHFNTPELTTAAIKSLRKHGGKKYHVTVFDNSDSRPFKTKLKGVTVIDNTKGQVIDFDKFLEQYPDREKRIGCAKGCIFGSAKHMRTVQELWDILPQGFVLMESDILLRDSIDFMWMEDKAAVGHVQWKQPGNFYGIGRIMPMLCYMNVPLLRKYGARYFDPERSYGLHAGQFNRANWYDTGAVLLEDIVNTKPGLQGKHVDIRNLIAHYQSGSWKNNDVDSHKAWLEENKELWK